MASYPLTGTTIAAEIPTGIVAALTASLTASMPSGTKITQYAGEFYSEEGVTRLRQSISQFPHVMYDVEYIDFGEVGSDLQTPESEFRFVIYCVTTDFGSETRQWVASYVLAWKAALALQSDKFTATGDINAEGYFEPLNIEREFHIPGMSAHTLRVSALIPIDINGTV